MPSEIGMGLAKFGHFAKVAKFSLRLRNFRNLSENFRNLSENFRKLSENSSFVDPSLLFILPSTASNFLHFALVFSLILGLVFSLRVEFKLHDSSYISTLNSKSVQKPTKQPKILSKWHKCY